jgi:hypothetical protein
MEAPGHRIEAVSDFIRGKLREHEAQAHQLR